MKSNSENNRASASKFLWYAKKLSNSWQNDSRLITPERAILAYIAMRGGMIKRSSLAEKMGLPSERVDLATKRMEFFGIVGRAKYGADVILRLLINNPLKEKE